MAVPLEELEKALNEIQTDLDLIEVFVSRTGQAGDPWVRSNR